MITTHHFTSAPLTLSAVRGRTVEGSRCLNRARIVLTQARYILQDGRGWHGLTAAEQAARSVAHARKWVRAARVADRQAGAR